MVVGLKEFPFHILLPKMKNHWEATSWCEKNFGPRWEAIGYREGNWCTFWRGRDVPGSYDWYFKNERDYVLFTLRWV